MNTGHTVGIVHPTKKIAIVCFSNSLGGLELSALRLAETMTQKGTSVLLIVPPSSPLAERAARLPLTLCTLAPRWKYGDLTTLISFVRVLKTNHVDVVLLMQSKEIHLAAVASVFVQDLKLVYYQQMNSLYNKRDALHTWSFSRLAFWFTLTHRMKDDVLASTRMPHEKVKVVPLGSDLRQFDPARINQTEARLQFGLHAQKTIVGVLGRLDKVKGQHVLLRAIPAVLAQHPDTFFVIAGDETAGEPGYGKYLLDLCRQLGIEEYVKFLPFTENVPEFMSALDVFVLPSFSETFGLVVVEAMAMGRPIIATNSGGVPEIITHDKTGLLIQPQDEHEIARAIHRILSDNSLRSSMGRAARQDALARYDHEQCVNSLLASLSSL